MANGDAITHDLLEQAISKNVEILREKNLSRVDRSVLESQNLVLTYLREDHKMVTEMYPAYEKQKAGIAQGRDYARTAVVASITGVVALAIHMVTEWIGFKP